jgi:hypothetical protein
MPKSELLKDLKERTTSKLLKALLEVHNSSPEISQEQKTLILEAKLEEIFRGLLNETHKY